MGNLMMRWNRKASGSRLLETETPKNSRCLPVTPRSKLSSRCNGRPETPQPLPYLRPVNPPQSVNRPQPVGHSQPPVAGQWAPASEPRPMPPIPSGTGRPGMRQPIQSYPPYPSQLYSPYPPYPPYSSAQRPVAPPIPVAQPVPIDPVKARRRWLRGTVTRHAGLIFAYQGVFMGVNVLASFVIGIILGLSGAAGRGTLTAESLSAALVQLTGVIMLLTVLGGMGFILPMRRRMIFRRDFWLGEPGHARMKPSWLLTFIILVMAIQTAIVLIQLGFSMFGTTLQSPTSDNISEASTNIWMWLYVGLAAPVAEELVFRGVLMRGLKPLGRNFAIVTSALMFGLFHDDVVQGLFAFGCGLLFGFVAMEYSLVWSIVLHVFNNAVLGGVLPWLAGLFGDAGDTAYTLGLLGVSIIGLIVVLVKYGGGLRAYRRVNRSAPGTYWGVDVACVPNFRDRECGDHDTVVRHRDDGRLTSLADGLANAPGVAGLPLFLQWVYRRVCGAGSGPASVECLESHE